MTESICPFKKARKLRIHAEDNKSKIFAIASDED